MALDPVNTLLAVSAGAFFLGGTFYVLFGSPFERRANHTHYYPGLYNLGNTCFLNAILQAFASVPPFINWLRHTNGGPLARALHQVLAPLTHPAVEEDNCNPNMVLVALQEHGWMIDLQQQDSHELYHVLLSTLQEEQEHHSVDSLSSISDIIKAPLINRVHSRNGKVTAPRRNHNSVFTGLLAGELMCVLCGYRYPTKYETFDSLSLTLSGGMALGGTQQVSVDTCLRQFVQPEPVKDVLCPLCHRNKGTSGHSTFLKSLRIGKAPQCLVIHIRRTAWLPGSLHKVNTLVSFKDTLDLKPYMYSHVMRHALAPPPQEGRGSNRLLYSLRAVVVHMGGANSGHYVTYRKTIQSNWVYTSDTSVYPVHRDVVMSSAAYMLFYEIVK